MNAYGLNSIEQENKNGLVVFDHGWLTGNWVACGLENVSGPRVSLDRADHSRAAHGFKWLDAVARAEADSDWDSLCRMDRHLSSGHIRHRNCLVQRPHLFWQSTGSFADRWWSHHLEVDPLMIKKHFESMFDSLNSGFSGFRFTGGKTTFASVRSLTVRLSSPSSPQVSSHPLSPSHDD